MSLERTALRLATVMALSNGFEAPFPTQARERVYDSRIDAIQITNGDEMVPIIVVCTDDDRGASISANNGGFPFEHSATLSIDISLAIPNEDGSALMHLATEAELEVHLDLFEGQVRRVLTARAGRWGQHFDAIARRITDYSSMRYVEPDGNTRLVARQIQMTVMLPLDCSLDDLTVFAPGPSDPPLPPESIPAPLGPLLTDIITYAPLFAPQATQIQTAVLAGGAGSRTVLTPLERLRIIEDDRDELDRPTTERPDGVGEATFL